MTPKWYEDDRIKLPHAIGSFPCRMDVLYGLHGLRPDFALRLFPREAFWRRVLLYVPRAVLGVYRRLTS